MDAYYLLDMKSYITKWMLYLLNVIPTMSIYGILILNLLPTSYVTRTNSSSDVAIPMSVNIQGYASLQSTYLIMLVTFV